MYLDLISYIFVLMFHLCKSNAMAVFFLQSGKTSSAESVDSSGEEE